MFVACSRMKVRNWVAAPIVIMLSILINQVQNSQVIFLTPKTMRNILGCMLSDPIMCDPDQEWVLLFFDSNNSRQWSTFQYLIPSLNKQIAYAQQTHVGKGNTKTSQTQDYYIYPNTGLIDCYSSPSLCRSVGSEDLPLVLYKNSKKKQCVNYIGYVTLSGLISFVKTHDPKTSFLAAQYQYHGQLVYGKASDFEQRQIKQIFKRLLANQNMLQQERQRQKQRELRIRQQRQEQIQRLNIKFNVKVQEAAVRVQPQETKIQLNFVNNTKQQSFKKQQQATLHSLLVDNDRVQIQKQIKQQSLKQRQDRAEASRDKQRQQQRKRETEEYEQRQRQNERQKQSGKIGDKQTNKKDKKSKKQKQKEESKKKRQSFFQLVDSSSEYIVNIFREMGIGGLLLSIISKVIYSIVFVFFLILQLAG